MRESESAKLEMEAAKVEVQFRTETSQELRTENQKLHDEVKVLKRVHEQAAGKLRVSMSVSLYWWCLIFCGVLH
mgnify:CR=1 FL=1